MQLQKRTDVIKKPYLQKRKWKKKKNFQRELTQQSSSIEQIVSNCFIRPPNLSTSASAASRAYKTTSHQSYLF